MEVSAVFHSISLIAILIVIGLISARFYTFNNDSKQVFTTLITNVGMPALILSSIFNVDIDADKFKTIIIVFILSIVINIFGLILGYIATFLFNGKSNRRIEIIILSAFGNTGFIGIPLCAVLFGPEGALYAAIFDAGVDATIWTVGVYLLKKERKFNINLLRDMINMPLLAIIFGLSIAALGIKMPIIVLDLTGIIAAFSVPLAMFFIGAILKNFQQSHTYTFTRITYPEIIVPISTKLIILPIIVSFILINSRLPEFIIYILIIQSMMPTITLSSILFSKYSRDGKFGALIIIISTIASLLIIPTMIYIIQSIS